MLARRFPKSASSDLVGQHPVILLLCPSLIPFVCQFGSDQDGLDTFFNPVLIVTQTPIFLPFA